MIDSVYTCTISAGNAQTAAIGYDSPMTSLFWHRQIAIFIVLFVALTPSVFAAEGEDLIKQVMSSPPVRFRMEGDHRISLGKAILNNEETVHVYLTHSDKTVPYVMSLGWFVMVKSSNKQITEEKPKVKRSLLNPMSFVKRPPKEEEPVAPNPILSPTIAASNLVCIDEFGERLPAPMEKPGRSGFNSADWHALRGFDAMSQGEMKEALQETQVSVEEAPASARLHNNYGVALALSGKLQEAQKEIGLALKINPDYPAALTNRSWIAYCCKQYELSLADAKKACELDDGMLSARIAIARNLLAEGKIKEAKELVQNFKTKWGTELQILALAADVELEAQDYQNARQTLKKLALLNRGNAEILVKLAYVCQQLGDLDEAMRRAREATVLAPEDIASHITLGNLLEDNRDYKGAYLQYERAMELKPDSDTLRTLRGPYLRSLLHVGEYAKADQQSANWVKEDGNNAEVHYNRAWVLGQLPNKKEPEAISEYIKALNIDPKMVSAYYNLALLYVNQGNRQLALSSLKRFVDSAPPNDPDVAQAKELFVKLSTIDQPKGN